MLHPQHIRIRAALRHHVRVQLEPSAEIQTVVVEPVVPSITRSLSKVVKYGPKSNFAAGGLAALRQPI